MSDKDKSRVSRLWCCFSRSLCFSFVQRFFVVVCFRHIKTKRLHSCDIWNRTHGHSAHEAWHFWSGGSWCTMTISHNKQNAEDLRQRTATLMSVMGAPLHVTLLINFECCWATWTTKWTASASMDNISTLWPNVNARCTPLLRYFSLCGDAMQTKIYGVSESLPKTSIFSHTRMLEVAAVTCTP